MKKQDLS